MTLPGESAFFNASRFSVSYYQRLMRNEGKGEALGQTQQEMLKNPQYQHPYYWAAFIASGDWTSMGLASPAGREQSISWLGEERH